MYDTVWKIYTDTVYLVIVHSIGNYRENAVLQNYD